MNIGRRNKKQSKSDFITVRVDKSMAGILLILSIRSGISKSELIREGIRKLFMDYPNYNCNE